MKLTPEQRRKRIYEMMDSNEQYQQAKDACDSARAWFQDYAARLPDDTANRLHSYPGQLYFMHHRMLDDICNNMKFQDED